MEATKPPSKRLIAISVGSALTIVTTGLLVVGFLAVKWLAGDTRPPRLELPQADAGDPPTVEKPTSTAPETPTPEVLRPHDDALPTLGFQHDPSVNGPIATPSWPTPDSLPTTDSVRLPGTVRTAEQDVGPRYR